MILWPAAPREENLSLNCSSVKLTVAILLVMLNYYCEMALFIDSFVTTKCALLTVEDIVLQ